MLSKRLKILRAQTPYSQEEIANKIGVARTTYAMYEQGKREPDNETIEKLADYYDVTIDYLYGRTDNPNRIDQDEAEFQAFANNPSLQKWYKELPKSKEEDLERLRMMWEILKNDSK